MLTAGGLFVLLIGWNLYDGDFDLKDAGIFIGILTALLLGVYLFNLGPFGYLIATILVDIILIIRTFGRDLTIH